MARRTSGAYRKVAKESSPQPAKPQRKLSSTSATVWLALMARLIGSVDPKNDHKEFKVPEDLILDVENWTGGLSVFIPAGSEIHLPNQKNGINPSNGKPIRGTGYVLVTVEDTQRKIIYVLKESGSIVSFECRPQPITHRPYTSSVPYPPTLA